MAETMAETGTSDTPRAEQRDPLNKYALIFLVIGIATITWMLVLFALFSNNLTREFETLLVNERTWVFIATVILLATVVGLIFVIVGRAGATQGGSYISADLEAEAQARRRAEAALREVEGEPEEAWDPEDPASERSHMLRGAKIVDPFGADGKIQLAYTVPPEGGPGIYGDVFIRVDSDATLNVRTRLAKLRADAGA